MIDGQYLQEKYWFSTASSWNGRRIHYSWETGLVDDDVKNFMNL